MKVKNQFVFVCALLITVPLVYFLVDRTTFVVSARKVTATVESIAGSNDRCGRRRSKHNCTKFNATLHYIVDSANYYLRVSAGSARGHDQPISRSDYAAGQSETVAYDPDKPQRAFRDTTWDIWGAPIATFLCQIAAFVASFAEKKRRD
jgi:Protein of unknown function (DUF3592)